MRTCNWDHVVGRARHLTYLLEVLTLVGFTRSSRDGKIGFCNEDWRLGHWGARRYTHGARRRFAFRFRFRGLRWTNGLGGKVNFR